MLNAHSMSFFLTIIFKVTQYVANAAPPTCATVDGVYDQSQAGNMTISPNPPKKFTPFFSRPRDLIPLNCYQFLFLRKTTPSRFTT